MSTAKIGSSLVFSSLIALALSASPAFAQHGGGGGHSGSAGSHSGGGGGGGFHSSGGGGGFHGGGAVGRGEGGERERSGGFSRQGGPAARGPSYGGPRSSGPGNYSRGGAAEPGRNLNASEGRSSNIHAAINDGQWHSFGGSTAKQQSASGPPRSGSSNTNLVARTSGTSDANGHGFGAARDSSVKQVSSANGSGFSRTGFNGGGSRSGFGFRGGCCWRSGFGYGRGFGGWGLGFGFGYPFWAFGWDPWWYNPFWYGPYWNAYGYGYYPGYNGYLDYSDDWSNNPPPYRPGSWPDQQANSNDANGNNANGNNANGYGLDGSLTNDSSNDSSDDGVAPLQPDAVPTPPAASSSAQPVTRSSNSLTTPDAGSSIREQ